MEFRTYYDEKEEVFDCEKAKRYTFKFNKKFREISDFNNGTFDEDFVIKLLKTHKGSTETLDKFISNLQKDITKKNNFSSVNDLLKKNLCLFSLQYIDRMQVSETIKILQTGNNLYPQVEADSSKKAENENSKEENEELETNFISEELLKKLVEKFYKIYEPNYNEFFERWNSDKGSLIEYKKFKKYLKKSVEPFKYTNHAELYQSIMEREFTLSVSNDSPDCKYESIQMEDIINKFIHSKPEVSEEVKFINKKTERVFKEDEF